MGTHGQASFGASLGYTIRKLEMSHNNETTFQRIFPPRETLECEFFVAVWPDLVGDLNVSSITTVVGSKQETLMLPGINPRPLDSYKIVLPLVSSSEDWASDVDTALMSQIRPCLLHTFFPTIEDTMIMGMMLSGELISVNSIPVTQSELEIKHFLAMDLAMNRCVLVYEMAVDGYEMELEVRAKVYITVDDPCRVRGLAKVLEEMLIPVESASVG